MSLLASSALALVLQHFIHKRCLQVSGLRIRSVKSISYQKICRFCGVYLLENRYLQVRIIAISWKQSPVGWLFESLQLTYSSCLNALYSFVQARSHGGAFGGSAPLNFFCASPNFLAHRKICFKHIVKAKIVPPKKMYCAPPNLETWLRTWFRVQYVVSFVVDTVDKAGKHYCF